MDRPRTTTPKKPTNSISEITRQDIFDWLRVSEAHWWGRVGEVEFLGPIFDLDTLPSYDSRYPHISEDISKHRFANDDWPDDWVFTDDRFGLMTGPDDTFLHFLRETVHPAVHSKRDEIPAQVEAYNKYLLRDGWKLVPDEMMSGHPIYESVRVSIDGSHATRSVTRVAEALDAEHLRQQIRRMEGSIESDPSLAIGTAKELIETVCKGILAARGVPLDSGWDVPQLVKATSKTLGLLPDEMPQASKGIDYIRRVLQALPSVAGGIAELRNHYGTGHGREPTSKGLQPRHARLAVGAAATLVTFLFETDLARPRQPGSNASEGP
jgi:hypothetical protein